VERTDAQKILSRRSAMAHYNEERVFGSLQQRNHVPMGHTETTSRLLFIPVVNIFDGHPDLPATVHCSAAQYYITLQKWPMCMKTRQNTTPSQCSLPGSFLQHVSLKYCICTYTTKWHRPPPPAPSSLPTSDTYQKYSNKIIIIFLHGHPGRSGSLDLKYN